MDVQILYYIAGIVASIVTIGVGLWKFGDRLVGKINEAIESKLGAFGEKFDIKLDSLKAWVSDLSQGKGSACSRHEQRLDEHDRRLDQHDDQIAEIKDGKKRTPRKKAAP
jgi:hypothetical protein